MQNGGIFAKNFGISKNSSNFVPERVGHFLWTYKNGVLTPESRKNKQQQNNLLKLNNETIRFDPVRHRRYNRDRTQSFLRSTLRRGDKSRINWL